MQPPCHKEFGFADRSAAGGYERDLKPRKAVGTTPDVGEWQWRQWGLNPLLLCSIAGYCGAFYETIEFVLLHAWSRHERH